MGVYIKGMKMPKCCDECPIGEYEDSEWFSCSLMDMTYRHITQCDRLDDCPLVEVPEPHGRLIDAEKLKNEYPHDTDWDYPVNTNCYVCESIDNAPTAIEAEVE